jgi:hypothetical protein
MCRRRQHPLLGCAASATRSCVIARAYVAPLFASFASFAVIYIAAPAFAQEAAWLPTAEQDLAPWRADVQTALEAEGVVVRSSAHACESDTAALASTRVVGVQAAVCIVVAGGRAAVRLLRSTAKIGNGSAAIRGADVPAAVIAAYHQAELALELGAAGLLRVGSIPEGALVTLDDEPIGHAPLERRVPPGSHDLALTLDGFAGERQSVEITRGRVSEVHAKLVRGAADDDATSAGPTRPSVANWIVGGVLVAASVPALVVSIGTLANDGDCRKRDASDICTERVHFGALSATLLGFGAAALIAGGSIMLTQPFTVDVDAGADHAVLRIAGRL